MVSHLSVPQPDFCNRCYAPDFVGPYRRLSGKVWVSGCKSGSWLCKVHAMVTQRMFSPHSSVAAGADDCELADLKATPNGKAAKAATAAVKAIARMEVPYSS